MKVTSDHLQIYDISDTDSPHKKMVVDSNGYRWLVTEIQWPHKPLNISVEIMDYADKLSSTLYSKTAE